MKKKDLFKALEKFPDDIDIVIPCGQDTDDEFLYAGEINVEEMHSPEASGIDADGIPQTELIPKVILLPAEGPWAEDMARAEQDEEDEALEDEALGV